MRFELGLEKPNPRRAVRSAGTIAGAYIVGGIIPLGPYIVLSSASNAYIIGSHHSYRPGGSATSRVASLARHRSIAQSRRCSLAGLAAAVAFMIARPLQKRLAHFGKRLSFAALAISGIVLILGR
jgi:vacuolar iron transporter family protein